MWSQACTKKIIYFGAVMHLLLSLVLIFLLSVGLSWLCIIIQLFTFKNYILVLDMVGWLLVDYPPGIELTLIAMPRSIFGVGAHTYIFKTGTSAPVNTLPI
jgi:hypothetical protein